jgi:hypothetical protein
VGAALRRQETGRRAVALRRREMGRRAGTGWGRRGGKPERTAMVMERRSRESAVGGDRVTGDEASADPFSSSIRSDEER